MIKFVYMFLLPLILNSTELNVIESIDEKYLNHRIISSNNKVVYSSRLLLLEKHQNKLVFIYKYEIELSKQLEITDTNPKYILMFQRKY